MTDSRLARRPAAAPTGSSLRPFGSLPPATTTMTLERALELAGVDETELALLASTTFKEARSLEELVTLVATTRRRGLDGMLKHVYYERFGGSSSDPSLHVGIDGLRTTAARTGRFGGRSEPRYSGSWDMPVSVDEKGRVITTKNVPERCTMTVYAIVQNRSCAFEGVAWMEEAYPGPGPRGRQWQLRPRLMLSIAAERQALRAAFPAETTGLHDIDDDEEDDEPPRRPSVAENAALYDRIQMLEEGESHPPPPLSPRQDRREKMVALYEDRRADAIAVGAIVNDDEAWQLPPNASEQQVIEWGKALAERTKHVQAQVDAHSDEASTLAEVIEEAARLEVPFDDCKIAWPTSRGHALRSIATLRQRVELKKFALANPGTVMKAAAGDVVDVVSGEVLEEPLPL